MKKTFEKSIVSLSATMSIPQHVRHVQLDDEAVLLNIKTGLFFGLDEVGTRIWESISEGHSLDRITAQIVADYESSEENIRNDVMVFVEKLLAEGLVTTKS